MKKIFEEKYFFFASDGYVQIEVEKQLLKRQLNQLISKMGII